MKPKFDETLLKEIGKKEEGFNVTAGSLSKAETTILEQQTQIDHLMEIMPKTGATCEHQEGIICGLHIRGSSVTCASHAKCYNDKWKLKELKGKG
jgi:hypothetical protein